MGFFETLVKTVAASELLWTNLALIENIQVWVSSMTSAVNRPFRHTATVVSLAIVNALCEVGRDLLKNNATAMRQKENEQKKARVNRGRVDAIQQRIDQAVERQEILDNSFIRDWFDTVFVHRYRDVDPRIRVDCVQALGYWINTYPDLFFDGNHLRYLGWLLSDTAAHVRQEVIKHLHRLYKDKEKLGGLRTFSERFRGRMLEIATKDLEPSVRAAAVELLDVIRDAGLLEPDDTDAIGKLIFDSEPRVRAAVVNFFVENVNDLYESRIEELGGAEALEEALGEPSDENFDTPRVAWMKLKCLVEVLQSYDESDQDYSSQIKKGTNSTYHLVDAGVESRFTSAATAIYDKVVELRQWEVLAGYLLCDLSATAEETAGDDAEAQLKQRCKLEGRQEAILLEVLGVAVKCRLTQAVEVAPSRKGKKAKIDKQLIMEEQETAARHLAATIPLLLNKYGSNPETASIVLRLEHVLNLEVFQKLRQNSTVFPALLDDINKQFMTHDNQSVLAEASAALLHAKSCEELQEVTEGKVQALWEDNTTTLAALVHGKEVKTRGNLGMDVLARMSNTVLRFAKLSQISDCTELLEAIPSFPSKSKGIQSAEASTLNTLISIIHRGRSSPESAAETDALEDFLVINASKTVVYYFMWKVRSLRTYIEAGRSYPSDALEHLAVARDDFAGALSKLLSDTRRGADELRTTIAGLYLDLYTLLCTLRNFKPIPKTGQPPPRVNDDYTVLVAEIPAQEQLIMTQIFASLEKAFAKKMKKQLDEPAAGDELEDPDEDPIDDSDDEDEDMADASQQPSSGAHQSSQVRKQQHSHEALLLEQRLCEFTGKLVLAILGECIDGPNSRLTAQRGNGVPGKADERGPLRLRLERNKAKLGTNFRGVLNYLDVGKSSTQKKAGLGRKAAAAATANRAKAGVAGQASAVATPKASRSHQAAQKSTEVVDEEGESNDEEGPDDGRQHEEGTEEDLRQKELLDDDEQDQHEQGHDGEGEEEGAMDLREREESVLGD